MGTKKPSLRPRRSEARMLCDGAVTYIIGRANGLLLLIFEQLLAEGLASEVDALLEGLALLLGDEGVVGNCEGDLRHLVLGVIGLIEAEDYLCGDDAIEEEVELVDFLGGEILELLRCVEMQGLDSKFHGTVLLEFSCPRGGGQVCRFWITVRNRCARRFAWQRGLSAQAVL